MSDVLAVPTGTDVTELSAALDAVELFMSRFIVWPDAEHCGPMAALWAAHTHVAQLFDNTPRLVITALTPSSGKTRVLEVLEHLCASAERTSSITPSGVYSAIEGSASELALPTFLIDEIDKGMDEDLTRILNDGYRAGATVPRTVIKPNGERVVQRFPTFAPVALAGLSNARLADDLLSRSIRLGMERKPPGVTCERFTRRRDVAAAMAIREALAASLSEHQVFIEAHYPDMPAGLGDRDFDIWEPLVIVADAAGGRWPERARAACVQFAMRVMSKRELTTPQRLLVDIREVYEELMTANWKTDLIPTYGSNPAMVDEEFCQSADLVSALRARDDMPWGALSYVTVYWLAAKLEPFGIKPAKHRFTPGGSQYRGYYWCDFADYWADHPDGV